mgnify:FL=1|jgi:hypothetical protein|tara:strand:+ start:1187 stop:1432 length:246 start_codon:yes stop_codon:yes gene_type:complete
MAAQPKPRKKKGNSLINEVDAPEVVEEVVAGSGRTAGYKDGKDCVETKSFPVGKLPSGWKDTPAGLKNYSDNERTIFQEVD